MGDSGGQHWLVRMEWRPARWSVSASVNLPLHHKVQKFSSGTGSPGWSRRKGRKTVVRVCVCTTAPKRSVCGLDTGSHMYTVKWVADGQISQWDIVIVRRKQLSLSFHCYQVTSYLECSYQWTQLYFLTCTRRQPVPEHRQHITVN